MIQRERGQYVVNFGLFDAVYEHETLPYSAEDLDRLQNGESPEEDLPLQEEKTTDTSKKHLNVGNLRNIIADNKTPYILITYMNPNFFEI